MDVATILDKMKYVVQTMNEKLDSFIGEYRAGGITIALLFCLLFFPNPVTFLVIAVVGIQRVFYQTGAFKDEDEDEDTVSER
jgi:hypothetical protein